MSFRLVLCRLFVSLFFLVALPATAETPLRVFVSIPPQQYLVERIGGDFVEVRVLLAAGQTPETFDPSMRQLKSLADSDVYFLIGVPFESSWKDTLERTYPGLRVIDCCEEILQENEQGLDPHIWTSPAKAAALSGRIFRVLTEENPDRRSEYAANHELLLEELSRLDARARQKFSIRRTDYFITAHASWGHLAREYGVKELSMEKNGREIGPKGMSGLLKIARREGIRTIFVQPQYRSPVVQTLANEIGADVKILDPLAKDYIGNMETVIERIAEALQ